MTKTTAQKGKEKAKGAAVNEENESTLAPTGECVARAVARRPPVYLSTMEGEDSKQSR